MAKEKKRKARKETVQAEEFLKPIDITKFGTDDDPCFGKHYNLSESECKRCGDNGLCAIVTAQKLSIERKNIEGEQKFKDLERGSKENKALESWIKDKISEGISRVDIIKKAKSTFGVNREEVKDIYKRLK